MLYDLGSDAAHPGAAPDWRAKAWATALVLIVLVLALNVFARVFSAWRARKLGGVSP